MNRPLPETHLEFGGPTRIGKQVQNIPILGHLRELEMVVAQINILIDAW